MLSKIWFGLVAAILLGLLWLGVLHIGSAYYLNKGGQLLNKNNNQAAIHYLETALRFEANNALAYRWLARAYLQLDQPEKALAAAQQALHLSPHNPLVQLETGDAYDRLGDTAPAIAHYEAGGVGDRTPQLLVNYLKLADKLWLAGEQEAAIALWRDKVSGFGYADLYANWRLFQYYAGDDEKSNLYRQAVMHFPEPSIMLATDPRLANYQIEAISGVIKDNLWPQEVKLNVLAYQVWHGNTPSTVLLLQRLTELMPEDADAWYYLAEFYRHHGDLQPAKNAYQKTIELAPDYAMAYLRLGTLNETRFTNGEGQEWLSQATSWYQQYYQLAPEDPLGLKKLADLCKLNQCVENIWLTQLEDYLTNREPKFVVNQELDDWLFQGYDVDEDRLVRGEPTTLWLYWQGLADAAPRPNTNFYQLGKRWVQVVEKAQNLAINGDFETGGEPIGFTKDLYPNQAKTRAIVTDVRYGQATQVALLSNSKTLTATSFVSNDFTVKSDNIYLQAGWIKSEEGSFRMGRQWTGNLKKTGIPSFSYMASPITTEPWTHYAEIIKPAEGANETQIWLRNYKATGKVYFDNVLFISIGKLSHP